MKNERLGRIVVVGLVTLMIVAGCGKHEEEKVGGREKFVIPFSLLEPSWSVWKGAGLDGEMTISDMGIFSGGRDTISFDSNGRQIPPTKSGSVITFHVTGSQFRWVNGIILEGHVSFKVVEAKGLVYESGKGACVLPDGKRAILE